MCSKTVGLCRFGIYGGLRLRPISTGCNLVNQLEVGVDYMNKITCLLRYAVSHLNGNARVPSSRVDGANAGTPSFV